MSEFTVDDIKLLAKQQRDMDAGIVPFVLLDGARISMMSEVMLELDLHQGQSIDQAIFGAILEQNIAFCQAQIALEKAQGEA